MPDWWITKDGDEYVLEMYERHYSNRQRKNGRIIRQFVGPGEHIILRTWNCDAIFCWRKFIDDSGQDGVNCAFFRNESNIKSSVLIRQADAIADFCWPGVRHYTYVNEEKIKSNNPGCCFKKAGWIRCGKTKGGLIVLEKKAPAGVETKGKMKNRDEK